MTLPSCGQANPTQHRAGMAVLVGNPTSLNAARRCGQNRPSKTYRALDVGASMACGSAPPSTPIRGNTACLTGAAHVPYLCTSIRDPARLAIAFPGARIARIAQIPSGIRRQWNTAGRERFVVAGLQVRQPAEGVDDLGIDLAVSSRRARGMAPRAATHRGSGYRCRQSAGKTARQQVRLETADDADQKVRQYHRRAAEAFHGEGVAVPRLEPTRDPNRRCSVPGS